MNKNIAMKRAGQVALLLIAICLMAMPVFASTTTLTVNIPQNVKMDIQIEGCGVVVCGDLPCRTPSVLEFQRNQTIIITATPDDGWRISSAVINGKDYTNQLRNGEVILDNVTDDGVMRIIFERIVQPPPTGDTIMHPLIVLTSMSFIGICLLLKRRKTAT